MDFEFIMKLKIREIIQCVADTLSVGWGRNKIIGQSAHNYLLI